MRAERFGPSRGRGRLRPHHHFLIASAILAGGLGATATAHAEGVLVTAFGPRGRSDGFAYAWSANHASLRSATDSAMDECRKQAAKVKVPTSACNVTLSFTNQCVSVVFDPKGGASGIGWAVGRDKVAAERDAMARCRDTADSGRASYCRVDVTTCDGTASSSAPPAALNSPPPGSSPPPPVTRAQPPAANGPPVGRDTRRDTAPVDNSGDRLGERRN